MEAVTGIRNNISKKMKRKRKKVLLRTICSRWFSLKAISCCGVGSIRSEPFASRLSRSLRFGLRRVEERPCPPCSCWNQKVLLSMMATTTMKRQTRSSFRQPELFGERTEGRADREEEEEEEDRGESDCSYLQRMFLTATEDPFLLGFEVSVII